MALNTKGTPWQFSTAFIQYLEEHLMQRAPVKLQLFVTNMQEIVPVEGEVVVASLEGKGTSLPVCDPRERVA